MEANFGLAVSLSAGYGLSSVFTRGSSFPHATALQVTGDFPPLCCAAHFWAPNVRIQSTVHKLNIHFFIELGQWIRGKDRL